MSKTIAFQCCFCHDVIPKDEVVALLLIVDMGKLNERSQQWFCHAGCFTKSTGERIDVLETPE